MCILGMTNSFHGKCPVSIIHMYGEKKTSGHFCKFNSPCLMPICIMFVVELISQFYFVCHDKWQWNFSWKWIFHKKCWFFRFQWPLHVRNKGLFIEWIKFLENVFFMSLLIKSQSNILLKYNVWNFLIRPSLVNLKKTTEKECLLKQR